MIVVYRSMSLCICGGCGGCGGAIIELLVSEVAYKWCDCINTALGSEVEMKCLLEFKRTTHPNAQPL